MTDRDDQLASGRGGGLPSSVAARAARQELGQIPGLDGLRGIGVMAAAVSHASYHAGSFSLVRGSFFAILMFFVLSGFLITSLLLLEVQHGGTIPLRAFWSRRYRRLIPASLVGVALVLAFSWFAADASQLSTLRGDVAAALTYTTNWRQLFAGQVYANQIGSPTPLLHYWSLAIEEQFYLVLPLVMVAAHRLGRGHRNAIPAALAALLLGSLAVVAMLATSEQLNPDRLYYGTDARAAEFLAGSLLGVWFTRNRHLIARHARAIDLIGWVGFTISMVLWFTAELSDAWIYEGGLQLGIIPAVAMVLGTSSGGTLSRVLSIPPLREIGRISYGVYVLHWPIVLWLTPERTGIGAAALLPLQMAIVIAAAWCTFNVLEAPVRNRTLLRTGRAAFSTTVVASAVLLALTVPVVAHGPKPLFDFEAIQRQLDVALADTAIGDGVGVGFFGDSTALIMSTGTWAQDDPDSPLVPTGTASLGGCGVNGAAEVLINGEPVPRPRCGDWPSRWSDALDARPADIAVVSTSSDVLPASFDDGPYELLTDPQAANRLLEQMLRAVDVLHGRGALVVWIRQPPIVFGVIDGVRPDPPWPESDPALMARYNELVDQLPLLRPGAVEVLDLEAHLASLPGGVMDTEVRPDLIHLSLPAAQAVARDWLRPALEAIATTNGLDRADGGEP